MLVQKDFSLTGFLMWSMHRSSNVAPYREHVIYLDLPFSSLFLVVEVNEVVMKNKLCGMRRVLPDGDFGSFNDDLSF